MGFGATPRLSMSGLRRARVGRVLERGPTRQSHHHPRRARCRRAGPLPRVRQPQGGARVTTRLTPRRPSDRVAVEPMVPFTFSSASRADSHASISRNYRSRIGPGVLPRGIGRLAGILSPGLLIRPARRPGRGSANDGCVAEATESCRIRGQPGKNQAGLPRCPLRVTIETSCVRVLTSSGAGRPRSGRRRDRPRTRSSCPARADSCSRAAPSRIRPLCS